MDREGGTRLGWTVPLLVTLLMFTAPWTPLGPPGTVDTAAAAEGDLTVTDAYTVSGVETFQRITVTSSGSLEVPSGSHLVANTITMQGYSELLIQGGSVLLRGGPGADPGLVGTCDVFTMERGSSMRILGDNGTTGVDSSMGADAVLDLDVRQEVTIVDSTLEVIGGDGLSPEAPLSPEGLTGDHCSGGDAVFSLTVTGPASGLNVSSSTVLLRAGDGGAAPDGVSRTGPGGTHGGGYSDGGEVGGHVGEGGSVEAHVLASRLTLDRSTLSMTAGDGGDAGDGADQTGTGANGGGGGGYSGGAGASSQVGRAEAGGQVSGDVGSGGDATLTVTVDDVRALSSGIVLLAGDGGDAGTGGDALPGGSGGGGGGGYSSGGGGRWDEPRGADGGLVMDRVGSGGDASADLVASAHVEMELSTLEVRAGNGGRAGDGGTSTGDAGGGGGGYSGGGGSGSFTSPPEARSMYGGDGGTVEGGVASGGDATLRVNSTTAYMERNSITVTAGSGGDGGRAGRSWQDPDTDMWMGGGGGGSYSAGGGGGWSGSGPHPRGGGQGGPVTGRVGNGGESSLRLEIVKATIHAENNITSTHGEGGLCWRSRAAGVTGGDGTGRFTRDGRGHAYIPRCRTQLLEPAYGLESMELPVFSWVPVHGSTTNGDVMEYTVEMAYDPSFAEPVHHTTIENSSVRFIHLEKGTLYWRVTPMYARPERRLGIPSEPSVYVHLNSPPVVLDVPEVEILVRTPTMVDLAPYIRDSDDSPEDLVVTVDSGNILWRTAFIITFSYESYQRPHSVHFNVTDGFATTSGHIPVRVMDDNHDPFILGLDDMGPPVIIVLKEGEERTLKVRHYDRDGDPVEVRLNTTWDGISLTPNDNVHIVARPGDVGTFEPIIEAWDDRGGVGQLTIKVRVGNVNEPPEAPRFLHPANNSVYHEGDTVMFTVSVSDPDLIFGDTLELTVISDVSGVLTVMEVSGDLTFTTTELGPGQHHITAILQDGDFSVRGGMELVVEGDPEPTSVWEAPDELWLVVGMVAMAFALLAVSYIVGHMRRRRRRGLRS